VLRVPFVGSGFRSAPEEEVVDTVDGMTGGEARKTILALARPRTRIGVRLVVEHFLRQPKSTSSIPANQLAGLDSSPGAILDHFSSCQNRHVPDPLNAMNKNAGAVYLRRRWRPSAQAARS
jgi:hypothetical protein